MALHEADVAYATNNLRGAQNYMSCVQITVTSSGSQSLPGGTSWPGAYTPSTPGIVWNLYKQDANQYVAPGPGVWSGSAGGSIAQVGTPGQSPPPTTTAPGTTTQPVTTTAGSGGTSPLYGQCGGVGD